MFRVATGLRLPAIVATWARGVPILAYHGVTARPASPFGNLRRLHVPKARFEEHLQVLSREWHPIRLLDLVESIETRRSLPARSVVVTFDDGYRNVLTTALPLLRKYSVPATLFVTTHNARRMWEDQVEVGVEFSAVEALRWNGALYAVQSLDDKRRTLMTIMPVLQHMGRARGPAIERLLGALGDPRIARDDDRDLLDWEGLATLQKEGVEIGSHSDRHDPLTERSLVDVQVGLRKSHEALTERLGARRYALAYPYGASGEAIAAAARGAGFACAVAGRPGFNTPEADMFSLKRFLIGADDDTIRLRASLSGLRAFGQSGRAWGLA